MLASTVNRFISLRGNSPKEFEALSDALHVQVSKVFSNFNMWLFGA
jgi:hypothetical protein